MSYDLGIIIPIYRSTESVRLLVQQLNALFLPHIQLRICLVDDSCDPSVSGYLLQHCMDAHVSLITLDQNYGQQAATLCGLEHIEPCRYYATIDDDLEQPPDVLKKMYHMMETGCDMVYAVPSRSHPSGYRYAGSRLRDLLFHALLHVPKGIQVSSFRMMSAHIVNALVHQPSDGFFYLSAAVFRHGKTAGCRIRVENLTYEKKHRYEGRSGYSFSSLTTLYLKLLWHYTVKPALSGPTGSTLGPDRQAPLYQIAHWHRPPKLMVLGGSNCQIHALERTSAMGIHTVLVDYTPNPPAAALATHHARISTFDIPGCIDTAKTHLITGVMTMGTDQPVYTAACVSHACHLPSCLSEDEALAVTNKKRMKQILTHAHIPTVPYQLVHRTDTSQTLSGLQAPLVIKPLDSQGQRGIYKRDTPREILDFLPQTLSYSRCDEALVEEFYDSDEVTVSGWIQDGRLFILTVTDRLLYPHELHIGVCTGHRFPSVHRNRHEEIAEISNRIVEAFHLKNGPFYLQLLIGAQGIKVNELAGRIGGAFEDVFIPYITGFDILQAVIDSALGRCVSVDILERYQANQAEKAIAVQLFFCHSGQIASVTPLEQIQALPYILDAGYNYHPGQTIPSMENATARFGHAVVCGTPQTIASHVDDLYRNLSVTDTGGRELLLRLYP